MKQGFTWNPVVGCSGEGCAVYGNCYARRTAKRFKQRCQKCYDFVPHLHPERLIQPANELTPSGIFVCSMADLFDAALSNTARGQVLDVVERWGYHHRFILLTKQPQTMLQYNGSRDFHRAWCGTTINRRSDLWRLDYLKQVKAKVRFVSFEPLYEDLGEINLTNIDWLIIGGQTKPTIKPKDEWVLNIIRQKIEGTPVFLKNNLEWPHNIQQFPEERV